MKSELQSSHMRPTQPQILGARRGRKTVIAVKVPHCTRQLLHIKDDTVVFIGLYEREVC